MLDRPGKENQVADFISRLQNQGEVVPVEDSFPDENLFAISIVNPWYWISGICGLCFLNF